MMEVPAIAVRGVSKKFKLYDSAKQRFFEALHPFKRKYHRDFWALKNIDLIVPRGKTVGIIGRNGSGKSTLLQVICSVLRPTSGVVDVNGRVSALLELGSGFNPEFTGRENVLMNGRVMGVSDAEMKNRMSRIESFADIGEFIDQPVKMYSSGMFVRLAFSVAINVDPDILVVDEALAVGDAKFQHKCFQKFMEFQKSGKTTVFVTHDTSAIVRHCDYAILLENGAIMERGKPNHVVSRYVDVLECRREFKNGAVSGYPAVSKLKSDSSHKADQSELEKFIVEVMPADNCINRNSYNKNEYRQGYRKAEIVDYLVVSEDKYDPTEVCSGEMVDIYIKVKFHGEVKCPLLGFAIKTVDGVLVYALNSFFSSVPMSSAKGSDVIVSKVSVKLNLAPGDFFIDLGVDEQMNNARREWTGRQCAYESLDRRCAIIHLHVQERNWFHGFVDLEANFRQIAKNGKVNGDLLRGAFCADKVMFS